LQDYRNLSKEELIKTIQQLELDLENKKYGLIWDKEKEPEQVVLDCQNNLPILKEVKDKHVKTDNSDDNILIEGDNYYALSVLNYTHENKIDVIYIDPPYNTGQKDFTYNDKLIDKEDKYRHSKWLNFMEKRLNLSKKLLKKDGVIFISIDDNEYANLKLLSDKIFNGNKNYIGSLVWEKKKKGSHLNNSITNIKEYILIYAKDINNFTGLIGEITEKRETYPCVNPGNTVGLRTFHKGTKSNFKEKNFILKKGEIISAGNMSLILHSDLVIVNGKLEQDVILESEWRYKQSAIDEYSYKGEIYLTNKLYFRRIVTEARNKMIKDLLPRVEYNKIIDLQNILIQEYEKPDEDSDEILNIKNKLDLLINQNYDSINENDLFSDGWGSNEDGDNEQRDFFGKKVFDYPKPSKLILKLLVSTRKKNAIILDFMAGSGTTGQSVMQLNKLDGGNRKFILCTNNENKICEEITYPRLKQLIDGYSNRDGTIINGLNGNLRYFKAELLSKSESYYQTKINLVNECTEMLCIKENIYNLKIEKNDYKIFSSNDNLRYLAVYYNTEDDSLNDFLYELKNVKEEKIVYMFSETEELDQTIFKGIKNCKSRPIPQKILNIYHQLNKQNITPKTNTIFVDLDKAKRRIFQEKDKDDGASKLRIVLEQVIEYIAYKNGLNLNDFNSIARVNTKLKDDGVFTKVRWKENETYLTVGNDASHGDYDNYEMKQVKDFYKHIQSLITEFGVGK